MKVAGGSESIQHQGYSESKSYNYQAISLLRPDEIMRLPEHQILLMRTGLPPVKAIQFIWYKDQTMKQYTHEPVYVPKQAVQQHPFIRRLSIQPSFLEALET